MPSRMIHYLIAERIASQIPMKNKNRFKIGSLCPDMSCKEDGSKNQTHFVELSGEQKGINWRRFMMKYGEKMKEDDLYLGILCHLITDGIWFHEVMEPQIRAKLKNKEERYQKYQEGYRDFHRLNYILREEFHLGYELTEDRELELEGIHPEFYDGVFGGLYQDFFEEPPAAKEGLAIYTYEVTTACIELCIEECVREIRAFLTGMEPGRPERYYVPARER
ncbi:MAG: zinc dependent phospholipase C family protein [Lachnospiraceae bacterium]|nr:zinc dependent phospholipase C family protein [Lachnospiraceae bacterium]